MKRLLCMILIVCCLLPGAPVDAAAPSVKAHAYVLYDSTNDTILASSKKNKTIYPASTTKLMTAILIIENMDLNRQITYTKKMQRNIPAGCSGVCLKVGERYSVKQYLNMLLLQSDVHSAIALAMTMSGSVKGFAAKMNEKAAAIGMTKTSFDNPIGLDKGNGFNNLYTTAADFLKLSKYVMSNRIVRNIVAKKRYYVHEKTKGRTFKIKNTNLFYYNMKYNKDLYQIIGTKTGTTKAAGHVLIATAVNAQGREVICEFFGKSTVTKMYKDIRKLFNYAYQA